MVCDCYIREYVSVLLGSIDLFVIHWSSQRRGYLPQMLDPSLYYMNASYVYVCNMLALIYVRSYVYTFSTVFCSHCYLFSCNSLLKFFKGGKKRSSPYAAKLSI